MFVAHLTSGLILNREGRAEMLRDLFTKYVIPRHEKNLPSQLKRSELPNIIMHKLNADRYLAENWKSVKHDCTPDEGRKMVMYPPNLKWMFPCPLTCDHGLTWKWRQPWEQPSTV
jgi:hypothetical protein